MSVWIFINLVCFGMCGYLYLIWSQYWMYLEKQKYFSKHTVNVQQVTGNSVYQETYSSEKYVQNDYTPINDTLSSSETFRKMRRSAIGGLWSNNKSMSSRSSGVLLRPSSNIVRKSHGSPRFPNTHKTILELDSDKYICEELSDTDCKIKSTEFKNMLLKEFHRVLMLHSNVFKSGLDSQNFYNVKYENGGSKDRSSHEILCALSKVPLRTVTSHDEPFSTDNFHIPNKALRENETFNTCAVVTSAGALLGSRLGEFIGRFVFIIDLMFFIF